jgi:hypothetical protein
LLVPPARQLSPLHRYFQLCISSRSKFLLPDCLHVTLIKYMKQNGSKKRIHLKTCLIIKNFKHTQNLISVINFVYVPTLTQYFSTFCHSCFTYPFS